MSVFYKVSVPALWVVGKSAQKKAPRQSVVDVWLSKGMLSPYIGVEVRSIPLTPPHHGSHFQPIEEYKLPCYCLCCSKV